MRKQARGSAPRRGHSPTKNARKTTANPRRAIPASQVPKFRSRFLRRAFEDGVQRAQDWAQALYMIELASASSPYPREWNFVGRKERALRIAAHDVAVRRGLSRARRRANTEALAATTYSPGSTFVACQLYLAHPEYRGRKHMTLHFKHAEWFGMRPAVTDFELRAYDERGECVLTTTLPAGNAELIERAYRQVSAWVFGR